MIARPSAGLSTQSLRILTQNGLFLTVEQISCEELMASLAPAFSRTASHATSWTVRVVVAASVLSAMACLSDSASDPTAVMEAEQAAVRSGRALAPVYELQNPRRIPGRYIVRFTPDAADSRATADDIAVASGGRVL